MGSRNVPGFFMTGKYLKGGAREYDISKDFDREKALEIKSRVIEFRQPKDIERERLKW